MSLAPDPSIIAMMLADARLPVGGHVQSGGLEPALNAGLHPGHVPHYMRSRLRTVTSVEAGTAVVARHIGASEQEADAMRLSILEVETAWAARTPSDALRDVSRSRGRGLQRLSLRLWPEHPAVVACSIGERPLARPVVLGAVAAAAGLGAEQLARLVFYDDAQSVAAAMLKLEPLDPAIPVGWVLDACAYADALIPELASIVSPVAIPAAGAPLIEEWAQIHSVTTQRLFRA